jgi:hypothetical protein
MTDINKGEQLGYLYGNVEVYEKLFPPLIDISYRLSKYILYVGQHEYYRILPIQQEFPRVYSMWELVKEVIL